MRERENGKVDFIAECVARISGMNGYLLDLERNHSMFRFEINEHRRVFDIQNGAIFVAHDVRGR